MLLRACFPPAPHKPGYARTDCALWLRPARACAGFHAQRSQAGIPEPPRLDPNCGAAALAASLKGLGLPSDFKTVCAACRVTGFGGDVTAVNTFGANSLVSRNTGAGSTFYTFDAQGSVAQRLGSGQAVLSSDLYDGYGSVLSGGGDVFGFGGQWGYYTDAGTGLVLMTHRYYDPQAGRFLTRDRISYNGGVNLYAYTANDPINGIDPTGFAQVTTTGCTPDKKPKRDKAINDICRVRINLIQNLEARECAYNSCRQPIYIKCISKDSDCKQACSYASRNNNDMIHLCRKSGAINRSRCGCLSKTILWEMINNCGHPPGKDSPIAKCSNQPFEPGDPLFP